MPYQRSPDLSRRIYRYLGLSAVILSQAVAFAGDLCSKIDKSCLAFFIQQPPLMNIRSSSPEYSFLRIPTLLRWRHACKRQYRWRNRCTWQSQWRPAFLLNISRCRARLNAFPCSPDISSRQSQALSRNAERAYLLLKHIPYRYFWVLPQTCHNMPLKNARGLRWNRTLKIWRLLSLL